jgi:serine/threonine-protein kinase
MNDGGQLQETQKKACIVCQKEFTGDVSTCPDDGVPLTVLQIPRDPMVGTLFCDRFQITEVLGGGGMGMVYRAKHLMMQRTVAIKILHTKMVNNADALKRFKVEAQAASNFSHPNILNVHDFGVSNQGQPYMVMDFLDGINLTSLLDAEKRISVGRAVAMFLQIASALAHAHSKEIIHRDVKPSNIMLVEFEGRPDFVKLVDFGIAKVLNPSSPEAENLTRTGEVFGSPLYMSPEQCKGMKLDARADIYSLGAVMYRVVTGKPIFDSTDPLETMFRQVSEMPLSFAKACPDCEISEKLESVIFKCLAKQREERYQSMNELRDDLEAVTADLKSRPRLTAPVNTLSLEAERVTAHSDAESDSWLSDLSENTGAMPATPSFLNVQLDDVASATDSAAPNTTAKPPAGAVPHTVQLSPFSGVVSSTAPAGSVQPQSAPPQAAQPVPPLPAASSTSANSFSFSSSSSTLHQNAVPPRPSAVIDKRDETISIVVNKKSVALGSVALAVLLAIAGFLYFRPTGPAASSTVSATSRPDSQNASFTTVPSHAAPARSDATPTARPAVPTVARAVKKPAPLKKKAPKRKPNASRNYGNQDYYPTTTYRNSYSQPSAPVRSYDYQPPVQPVRQPDPVVVAPPPVHVPDAQPVRPSYDRYASRYADRYADQGVSKATNSRPGRAIKRILNKGFGILNRIAD